MRHDCDEKNHMNTPAYKKSADHFSHVSYKTATCYKFDFIHMLSLPPHRSQKTQLLSKVFFKPLKAD